MLEGTLSVYAFILLFPAAISIFLILLVRYYIRKTVWCSSEDRVDSKTILVTGGSSGIGRALAVELARRGARVVVACKTKARRDSTAFFLRSKTGSFNLRVMYMDMSSLDAVWEFAREFSDTEDRLDVIVNNAGIMCPQDWTVDGVDRMIGVNFLSHFLLNYLLADKMKASGGGRIISLVCGGFRYGRLEDTMDPEAKEIRDYMIRHIYRSSKLALYTFTQEFARRYEKDGICTCSVDPGLVCSNLYNHLPGFEGKVWRFISQALYRNIDQGMQTALHCVLTHDLRADCGKLFVECQANDYRPAEVDEKAKELWETMAHYIKNKGIRLDLKDDEEE